MDSAHIVRGEETQEGRTFRRAFDGRTAVCFFALDDADDGDDDHAGLLRGLDGVDGGCTGGANVIDDDDACALFAESFDATARAMGFLGFAD